MILIEGPRQDIGVAMLNGVRDALLIYDVRHVNHEGAKYNFRRMMALVQSDHRYEIHTGIVMPGINAPARQMLAYGLSTAGSCVVICGGNSLPVNILPTVMVNELAEVPQAVKKVVECWEHARAWTLKLWEYKSQYSIAPQLVMLVGDQAMPPAIPGARPAPFFGQQGQCQFLHEAMMRAGGKYYLTSALKYASDRANRDALIDEAHLIKPTKIVAMGTDAARMLARLEMEFVTTYHPQYWSRFKSGEGSQLVDILKP
jgi:hypothetical protein